MAAPRDSPRSRTYQLSWKPNDTNRLDERNFSHAFVRRLPAEVACDAISMATAGKDELAAALAKHPTIERSAWAICPAAKVRRARVAMRWPSSASRCG